MLMNELVLISKAERVKMLKLLVNKKVVIIKYNLIFQQSIGVAELTMQS